MKRVEKVRIIRVINRFNLGGPVFNVTNLTKYMDERFETKLVGGAKDESEASSLFVLEENNIHPVLIHEMKRKPSIIDDIRAYRALKKLMKEYKPHIVHTHASKAGALGRLAAFHSQVPIVVHTFHGHVFHSYFNVITTLVYKSVERWLAKRSTQIIAISQVQKTELTAVHRIVHPERCTVIPLGFDLKKFQENSAIKREKFRKMYALSDEEIAICIVGRLVPVKNHRMFIQVAKLAHEKHKNARFFIVGDGELNDELKEYCKSLGLGFTENMAPSAATPLVFTSWINAVDEVMAGIDIVALTSLNEGTPVSLIEAQSSGKPIVSTRVGGIEDVVIENESALLCESGDVQAFLNSIVALLDNRPRMLKMGETGREWVYNRFGYERLIDDMTSLYENLLEEKGLL